MVILIVFRQERGQFYVGAHGAGHIQVSEVGHLAIGVDNSSRSAFSLQHYPCPCIAQANSKVHLFVIVSIGAINIIGERVSSTRDCKRG
jgi:hypothetical protein